LQISNDKEQAIRLFQKALDLDANEHEAGQLLAELHAQAEEWTAVEMVARRIVSLLAASSSTETALSGTLILKKYAWAWRAIGMADIVRS
jgi:Tfp pilus assembly protein PilF